MIEPLYFFCYYAYLLGDLEKTRMYFSIIREEYKSCGKPDSLKEYQLIELKKIKDPDCKQLCAIAAYNTGAGNLSRAFTGKTNIRSASNKINKLNYDELYTFLRRNLPYDETRKYIKKVTDRMKLYKDWMGE